MRAVLNELLEHGLQSVREVEIEDYTDYYKHGNFELFDVVYIDFKGYKLNVFCDDEGALKSGNYGRLVGNYPQPIFGNVIVTGDVDEEGNTLPLPEELTIGTMYELFGSVQWQVR